ncbi:MAG TPA: TfuA-like protein [Methylomirabilota bacterium]|nr:TfuA-like protein [Methylomirabilota bacterium]
MKILFAGPSLVDDFPVLARRHPTVRFAGPLARGDLLAAVRAGATAVGIVDGLFREAPPVWHKEILYALSLGVAVAGGASMGALRAAECAPFGMVGIGRVHALFADGSEIDDACVAQVHAPEPLGWQVLSEAIVTVDATIAAASRNGAVTDAEADALRRANRALAYADRTFETVAALAIADPARRAVVARALHAHRDDVKRQDGLAVLDWLVARPDRLGPPPTDWTFAETSQWTAFLAEVGDVSAIRSANATVPELGVGGSVGA